MAGWANLVFETPKVRAMAKKRAERCAKCHYSVKGFVAELINDEIVDVKGMVCHKCTCPLSAKIRSPYEKCPIGLWTSQK